MPKTKNFNLSTDPKLQCTCGNKNCPKPIVTQEALDKLQLMRDDLGQPIIITSGARCKLHPSEASKKTIGDHQKCETFDIRCQDSAMETKLKVLAGRHGATRVAGGAYCGFVHVCFGETERKDVPTWSYK